MLQLNANCPGENVSTFTQGTYKVSDLLVLKRLTVPFWQRSYAWKLEQVRDFWDDLSELIEIYPSQESISDRTHFMGAIILIGSGNATKLEILDGQQRIGTSAILIRSAIKRLRKLDTAKTREIADWAERQFLVSHDPLSNTSDAHLTLGSYDEPFFQQCVINPTVKQPRSTKPSHKRILAATRFFDSQLSNFSEARLRHLLNTLTEHFLFLYLLMPDANEATEIFEVLNDRGIGLSTEDLVRGYLLQAVKADSTAQSQIVDAWEDLFQVIGERQGRNFLRHYWISQHGDVKARALNRTIRADINDSPSPKKRAIKLTNDMVDAAATYSDILSAEFAHPEITSRVATLVRLAATATYPAMLSLFRTYSPDATADRGAILTVLNLLLIALVRIRIVGQRDNSEFETLMFRVAPLVAAKKIENAVQDVKLNCPSDADFAALLVGVSVKVPLQAHYLLRRIEESVNPPLKNGIAPARDATLEHIYARKATDKISAHDEWINRLGNLTLLGGTDNSALKNKAFIKKKPIFAKSPFWLNKTIGRFNNWNENAIIKRQSELAKVARDIWSFADLSSTKIRR